MGADRDRWNERWAAVDASTEPTPPGVLLEVAELLPGSGRAIDLAGGLGDGALWLAERGLDATLAEVSDVALHVAGRRAAAMDVQLGTILVNLEHEPVPHGPWDLITCSHYLNRPMLASLAAQLAPAGVIVIGIATITNLERHDRPSARFLLQRDELPSLVGDELSIVRHVEDWSTWGVHEARLVAKRTAQPSSDPSNARNFA